MESLHAGETSERQARLEAERRNEALVRLQEASAGLLGLAGEAPSHDRLIEILCHVTGAPRGAYWLLDESLPGLPVLLACGTYGIRRQPRNDVDRRMQELLLRVEIVAHHPVAQAARVMKPVVLADTDLDPDWPELAALMSQTGIRSLLAVPLRARGRVLGVVALSWQEAGRAADEATARTAEVIANQIAAALDTAALIEELSRVNRLKDEFLATLSHELRNPLNVIVGYTEILSRDPEAQEVPVVRKAAEVIRRNAVTQGRLVSDLLDLSRLQTGKLAILRQPVQLTALVGEAVEAVRSEAATKRVELKVEPAPEPLPVEVDPVRIQQVVWNLLHNAVKFTPEGGRVTIRLERDGRDARVSVEDTGQGLDPVFLPELFEMFSQEDTRASRRHSGLGIGLALVRQLLELHGGRVRAESDGPDRGARFTAWLPLVTHPAERTPTFTADAEGALAAVRVLVVDDSPETATMLRQLLEFEGAEVAAALSGPEALRLAEARDFDLVISDIAMPGMDGYELLGELRRRPRTAGVPALAVTGYGQSEDADRAHAAGFFAHLVKPVEIARLIETARAAIEQPIGR